MLRRGLVLDLAIAGGTQRAQQPSYPGWCDFKSSHIIGLGTTFGYLWWYGFHLPRVRARDQFYAKLEDQRAREAGFS